MNKSIRPQPKALYSVSPGDRVELNPAGGGGYGNPFQRAVEMVLRDVVNGYVSLEAAEREYGVVIRYLGSADQLVRPPELYVVDEAATLALRGQRSYDL